MPNRPNNIENENDRERDLALTRRRILQTLGVGALLYLFPMGKSVLKDENEVDEEEKKLEEAEKKEFENGEIYEVFMGVELKLVKPPYDINSLPPLQQELMKKGDAKFDANTGSVVHGHLANYIIDEPMVEFKHTISDGNGKNVKEGLVQLKISAAKALIRAQDKLGEPIPIVNGFRSNDLQKFFHDRNKCLGEFANGPGKEKCEERPYPTADAGLSEHEKGQAIDIDTANRAKIKQALIECGFLDDTYPDPPHFTYKSIPFSDEAKKKSDQNDSFFTSPKYQKWAKRELNKYDKAVGKAYRKGKSMLARIFKRG